LRDVASHGDGSARGGGGVGNKKGARPVNAFGCKMRTSESGRRKGKKAA